MIIGTQVMTTIAEPNLCQLQAVQHSYVKKYEKTTTPNIKKKTMRKVRKQEEKVGIKRHIRGTFLRKKYVTF